MVGALMRKPDASDMATNSFSGTSGCLSEGILMILSPPAPLTGMVSLAFLPMFRNSENLSGTPACEKRSACFWLCSWISGPELSRISTSHGPVVQPAREKGGQGGLTAYQVPYRGRGGEPAVFPLRVPAFLLHSRASPMKTSLDHLPDRKRHDLERVVQIVFAEFEDATAISTQKWKKQGRIAKIILYGSYARGNWIEDHQGGYYSDYDILVVVSDERLADPELWHRAQDHLLREYAVAKRISAPVGMVVHDIADVNAQLSRSRPFFIDIVREGLVLYSLDEHQFEMPKPLDTAKRLEETEKNFKQWFESADGFLDSAKYNITKDRKNQAAFLLHQATEHAYHAVLLTLTLYSPKSHHITFLRNKSEDIARDLIPVWPRDTKFARRCFELLQQAYVKARYSPYYIIRDVELEWIVERVELLHGLVKETCEAHIRSIGGRT